MDPQNRKVCNSSNHAFIGNLFSSTFFPTFLGEYYVVVFGLVHSFANGSNPLIFFPKFMSMILFVVENDAYGCEDGKVSYFSCMLICKC